MKHISSHRAFTLIELLVVISIIGILAGLAFTGVEGARTSALRLQAKNDVVQIANAVLAFETEYGRLPIPAGTPEEAGDVTEELVNVLMGNESVPANERLNPRRIVFLEVSPKTPGSKRSGLLNGAFVDPWDNAYQIILDANYDNIIMVPPATGGADIELRRRVGVWNQGAPVNPKSRTSLTSWD